MTEAFKAFHDIDARSCSRRLLRAALVSGTRVSWRLRRRGPDGEASRESLSREPGTMTKKALVRVMFQLEQGMWHGSATETMWTEPVGPGQYRLANSPFWSLHVSNHSDGRAAGGHRQVLGRPRAFGMHVRGGRERPSCR